MSTASQPQEREFAFHDRDFKFLASMVNERTGIVLADHKRDMVYSRLARRLRALGICTFAEYCDLLTGEDGASEMGNLVNAITTNLTAFFREGHHFEHLREQVLRPLMQRKEKRIRIWSAGCSSGAEPYTIAMVLMELLGNTNGWDARILATDIDTNMLDTGQRGVYPPEYAEKVPPAYRKYTETDANGMRVAEALKPLISFKPLNLLERWPIKGPFDAIFCRNVVIYFDKPTQKTLFNRMAELIKPDGWLYIGHSENLHNVCDRFQLIGKTIYRRVK